MFLFIYYVLKLYLHEYPGLEITPFEFPDIFQGCVEPFTVIPS